MKIEDFIVDKRQRQEWWRRWRERKKEKETEEKEEDEKELRELWKEVKEELDLEIKLKGTVSKEMYYVVGKMLQKYKKGNKELSEHRIKTAKRIYSMYRKTKEFDDGIGIRKIARDKSLNFSNLARREWVSKILGGRSCYGKPID